MNTLEALYRRLLSWYPEDHRARHGEEMIGVLLAGAEPGRRLPDPRDAFDLVRGGILVRAQRLLGPESAPRWRDALNVAAIVAPLYFLVAATGNVVILAVTGLDSAGQVVPAGPHLVRQAALVCLALLPNALILLLALRGPRRAAVAWAWAWGLAGFALNHLAAAALLGEGSLAEDWTSPSAVLSQSLPGVLVALLLTFAPRPAEGATLMGRGTLLRWTAVSVLALGVTTLAWHAFMVDFFIEQLAVPALTAMACGAGSRTPVGRRAVLLVLPIIVVVYAQQVPRHFEMRGWLPLLLEVLLVGVLFTTARRGFRPYGSGTVSSPDPLA
ncbi:hypothetical protein HS041_26380 [Planomonospora sp. ID67723]|uniref:hypothetical protein n=1 Tax=Planomonospora sp. ID67723 TaxID=2738134 RepID=UPI0018C3E7AB|nr:hypothetical protein [Planomonospora sp. ID67723]MBG0831281.1 hypothetical protein [Planomonospora sp. ID67723]